MTGALGMLLLVGVYALRPAAPASSPSPPRPAIGWPREIPGGARIGPAVARVTIVEFADYQCPYCAAAHRNLKRALRAYDGKIALTFHDLPLERLHPFAHAAAIAAACAGAEHRFSEFHDVLFENQSSIGHRTWHDFAITAGLPQLDAFDQCVRESQYSSVVAADSARAAGLGLNSTPIIMVNGMIYERALSYSELKHEIDVALRTSQR